jgi:hypothetical protein
MIFALLLAATVGDPIVVDLKKAPVALEKSAAYEVVSRSGSRIIVRTFDPKPFTISGTAGGVPFRQIIPVTSVLKPNDDLKPAPLAPPRKEAEPLHPWVLIGVAAMLAIAAWTWLALRAKEKREPEVVAPPLTPIDRYRATVERLRHEPDTPLRWAQLADALRHYLAATRELSPDLTTTQLLAAAPDPVIADVLHHGDLQKFSPWGVGAGDFDEVARRALELAA